MVMMMVLLRSLYAIILLRTRNLHAPGSLFVFTIVVDWQFCVAIYHTMVWLFDCDCSFSLGVCAETISNALRVGSKVIYFALLPEDIPISAHGSRLRRCIVMVVASVAPVPALSGQFEIGWRAQMGCAASRFGHARIRTEELTKAEAGTLLGFR